MTIDNAASPVIQLQVNGRQCEVPDDGATLLEVLRDRLGIVSVKDGCSPQGQCGCCTVLVDGQARVSCVTPARRVRDRDVTTIEGLPNAAAWGEAFCATGGSQCGFCTPGIIVRYEALRAKGTEPDDLNAVGRALQAHLCRCTGWQTIVESWIAFGGGPTPDRDFTAAARRAEIEGGVAQRVGPDVALGAGGFADDSAPPDSLVAVSDGRGGWAVGETVTQARSAAEKVQGRRTTREPQPPLALPSGEFLHTLRTTWVEPGYLETDASWCEPGGEPHTPLGNGGAFGGKTDSTVGEVARRLADEHQRSVRVLLTREDAVRLGPKRPPVAAGIRADGTGVMAVVATPGIAEAIAGVAPSFEVIEIEGQSIPTSVDIRAAGWAEAAVLQAALVGAASVTAPSGGSAAAEVVDGTIRVMVDAGEVLDEVVLRSYCIGAAHMGFSWVTSEALSLDDEGTIGDLTVRSFGIARAIDTPPIEVTIAPATGPAVNGSDAVFAAVAAAVWMDRGQPVDWPIGLP